ncbi:MAG: sulfate adenylyltransferase subunit CysN [Emcibacteraceae bacterium]|nr:sulfate adenylyltransferase subunit CysN [Emcibacteraceae bacterium]
MTYQAKKLSSNDNNYQSESLNSDLDVFIKEQSQKPLLRFITCGSVDDGKSTLIGRLLYDSNLILEDQLAALTKDSKTNGTQGGEIDFALLVDGLAAEREQGVTIDVAYRFFETDKRKFIVADTPGHEEYTRNMATGASTADLAIILIDARKGVLSQTKRHSYIAKTLGIKHILVAVNKMDQMYYSEEVFFQIQQDYNLFSKKLGIENVSFIPISALKGENVAQKSHVINWYNGPSLIEFLETIEISQEQENQAFRLPVQWVNRPNLDFRGFAGTIASGEIRKGDQIVTLPSGKTSFVKQIIYDNREQISAVADQAITVVLENEIDISRGDIISKVAQKPEITDQLQAHIIWMSEDEMLAGRNYLFKTCNKTTSGVVTKIKHKINVNDLSQSETKTLSLNEIGVVNISLQEKIAFDTYDHNRTTGSFIIIDRITNDTVGCGMIDFGLRRASNIRWQELSIDKHAHATQKMQKPAVLWFTGLSGSGKSTIANLVEKKLYAVGKHSYLLDGDNVRHGLTRDLGFTDQDRVENIRRVGEVAKLMSDAGLIVLTSFISPFINEREMVRELLGHDYIEIFIDTPLNVCQERDPKGLYKKVKNGEVKNFTGIDSPYEVPQNPDILVKTDQLSPEDSALLIIKHLEDNNFI